MWQLEGCIIAREFLSHNFVSGLRTLKANLKKLFKPQKSKKLNIFSLKN